MYRVKELRLAKGLSQEKLAEMSGVSRGTIVSLESGDRVVTKTDTLEKLAQVLEVELYELFFVNEV